MIVLASGSPRRHQLLEMLGIPHTIDPPGVDETRRPEEPAERYAVRLAREKALAGAGRHQGSWVLGADTVVVIDGEMLAKPDSSAEAEEMLGRLAGSRHQVVTAVALARGEAVHERNDTTSVWLKQQTPEQIANYVRTGEPLDKAGAYAAQGLGAVLVERIEGDYFSVVGLPVRLVVELLEAAGIPYNFTR